MNIKLKVTIGFLVVLVVSSLTVVAEDLKVYSPYSLTVVISFFLFYGIDFAEIITSLPKALVALILSLPNALLFLASTIPIMRGNVKVSRILIGISVLLMLLSIGYLFTSYSYGIRYQGLRYTVSIYLFNAILIGLIATVLVKNYRKPTINNSLFYSSLLFGWLGWCAFPMLGEMM